LAAAAAAATATKLVGLDPPELTGLDPAALIGLAATGLRLGTRETGLVALGAREMNVTLGAREITVTLGARETGMMGWVAAAAATAAATAEVEEGAIEGEGNPRVARSGVPARELGLCEGGPPAARAC
jgi:hypothetical protein